MPANLPTAITKDMAFLVGVDARRHADYWPIESSMKELEALAKSAGAEIVGKMVQKLDNPRYFLPWQRKDRRTFEPAGASSI